MISMARRRIPSTDGRVRFGVGDAAQLSLDQPVDAVVSYMGAFFTFVDEPLSLLQRLRPFIRKKIILDLNPRGNVPLRRAIEIYREAGFVKIAWQPFFIPMTVKLPRPLLKTLCFCENRSEERRVGKECRL